jgi:hypothetical protein
LKNLRSHFDGRLGMQGFLLLVTLSHHHHQKENPAALAYRGVFIALLKQLSLTSDRHHRRHRREDRGHRRRRPDVPALR